MAKRRLPVRALIGWMRSKGFRVYTRPYELNILGVRSSSTIPNKFDDAIYVFYKNDNGKWVVHGYPATTDTGTYWLKNPMKPSGSALLKEGQYVDAYKLGTHSGYAALQQSGGKVTVYRDYDRDAVLDFNNGREETGYFGINIHRAKSSGVTQEVDRYSAGCQVFQSADDYAEFMDLVRDHENRYGNKFTYSLIDQRAFNRASRRYLLYLSIALGIYYGAKRLKAI